MSVDLLAAARLAWLDHYHACPECERRQLCEVGHRRIAVMRAGMAAEESLPAWMDAGRIGLVHAD